MYIGALFSIHDQVILDDDVDDDDDDELKWLKLLMRTSMQMMRV